MNDSEIVKALKCCGTTKGHCRDCPLNDIEDIQICQDELVTKAYKLITCQQAEIDTMKDTMAKLLNTLERANKYGLGADERIEQLKIELEKSKSEAVREFAERYKKEITERYEDIAYKDLFFGVIDRLLEEMGCNDGEYLKKC